MRVAFLVKGLETPRTRYRVTQYLSLLNQHGITTEVIDIPRGPVRRWRTFQRLDEFDLVVLQKKLFSALDFHTLRKKARRLIFDVDDAVMVRADAINGVSRRRQCRFERTIKEADLVFAGNAYLAGVAGNFGTRAILVPTCVDLNRYPGPDFTPGRRDEPIHLGWIGSRSTLPYLAELEPVFSDLGGTPVPLDLTIICNTFLNGIGLPVHKKMWSTETEVSDLMALDIGLAPLPENLWTVGKSATKVVQYMAAGLPVICSPVGANAEIVRDGVTGFYASNHKEWMEKIVLLAQNHEQRVLMGRAGRSLVEKNYSVQGIFPRFHDALMRLTQSEGTW